MVALCSRALAIQGWSVLVFDPLGCGDSPGSFEDASWDAWIDDLVRAHAWLETRGGMPVGLWALRAGALLASAALPRLGTIPQLVLWQPVPSGGVQLQQFLRLKVAAVAIGGSAAKISTNSLLERLQGGEPVEIAGYLLPPQLALPLQKSTLVTPSNARRTLWFEVSASDPPALMPASQPIAEAWRASGTDLTTQAVRGPFFWFTQEIEECPALIEATLRGIRAG